MTVMKRRLASTESIHHIWDAIVSVRAQKQIPNLERISNYMRRKHNISPAELEKQLSYAVQDSLIEMKKSVGYKGSKVGIEQEAYRIPEKNVQRDGHDWYCFECHKEGEVLYCSTCHRVYHEACLKEPLGESEKLVCEVCKMIKSKDAFKLKRDDLNLLLGYTCLRLKEKSRELHKVHHKNDEKWRYDFLIYEKMDLSIIEDKTQDNVYKRLEEFQADVQTLVHNVVLYYGVHSTLADRTRQMLRDCRYDLGEIRQCRDCYRTSNEKRDRFWFCQPCDPPHELVYAKQKGYPYWPAKVIRINNGVHDVRFFGGYHQRANIEKDHIKPITTSLQQLQLKRTAGLNKALEELKRHQQLLGQTPNKDLSPKKAKNNPSRPPSASSSRSNSGSRSRSRKGSVSSEEMSENEVEDGNSSQDECPSSSSPKTARFKDAPTPEDHNVVSSSCQESSPSAKVTVSTQTHKKLLAALIPPKPAKVEEKETPPSCDCEQKYSKMFKEFKERLEAEQKEEKERSLRELAERLRQDFEEEKQRVVAAALEKAQLELGEAKRKSEEQLRAAQQMEVSELMDRHRMEVSEIKKKQWCYNCEAEAIYHCCWNTSYCSVDCQQVHWHKEHKRTCRRKR
ncbi:zinc finger MYND domain-containing protein 11-like isoform X2 [Stegodyphus dumicola]|uniref:zinc finger MYND domain-containing protein 11-like isoform X2 n=1 Tax=Stegodyphus dumicola TaxID=202533 RepID=UPI0015B2F6D6|nr:zinc finger MYND domain-containing protein 11-like isoform X2 [Stegodyphus dumicola]